MTAPTLTRHAYDPECERGTERLAPGRCLCHHRLAERSASLPERPVWWPWLQGTPRAPHERELARRSRTGAAT